jgi:hypothetical protein
MLNFILSSAVISTVFGGACGAREQPAMETRSAAQPSPMIGTDCKIDFLMVQSSAAPPGHALIQIKAFLDCGGFSTGLVFSSACGTPGSAKVRWRCN